MGGAVTSKKIMDMGEERGCRELPLASRKWRKLGEADRGCR
jgi:hypothetical protein